MQGLDDLLYDALSPQEAPDALLNQKILKKVKEHNMEKNNKKRYLPAVVAVAAALILTSVTAFAAWRYMSAREVAGELADTKLANAFSDSNVINETETQSYGGYDVTLLGVVSGDKISDYLSKDDLGNIDGDKTYIAVAITHSDGSPMPSVADDNYNPTEIFVSPYIEGLNPKDYNAYSLGAGFSSFVKDGVEYRILETGNIEAFADRTIYIGVSNGSMAYNINAYIYDEATGELKRNGDFGGLNALFTVQLDKSKADKEKADALIYSMDNLDNVGGKFQASYTENDMWVNGTTPENIEERAEPIKDSIKTVTPDKDGNAEYSYAFSNGYIDEGIVNVNDILNSDTDAKTIVYGRASYDDMAWVETVTLNDDGTVTFCVWVPKE